MSDVLDLGHLLVQASFSYHIIKSISLQCFARILECTALRLDVRQVGLCLCCYQQLGILCKLLQLEIGTNTAENLLALKVQNLKCRGCPLLNGQLQRYPG